MQDFEVLDHQDSLRTISLQNGNKLNLKRSDPYGFWSIHYDKGQVPRELTGVYTSSEHALNAVKAYLQTKQLDEDPAQDKKKVSGS